MKLQILLNMASKISLVFLAVFCLVLCNAGPMQKRDADQSTIVSDANQALDKLFEDLNKGVKQLASDGFNMQDVFNNLTSKANQFGEQLQNLGKELGEKVQEAAKKQGLTS